MQVINHRELFYKGCYARVDEISSEARRKLDCLKKYEDLRAHGYTEIDALAFLGIKRSTLFLWKKKCKERGASGLENKSRAPHRPRRPDDYRHLRQRVCHLRKANIMWGKNKIAAVLQREGHSISASTVGRILKELMDKGVVKPAPILKGQHIKRRRNHWRKSAKKWKYSMKATKPGEMIQIDHMSVTVPGSGAIKHFKATCPITKITVTEVYRKADSATAKVFLHKVRQEMPFEIISIQTDGGSEFMKHFEEECETLDIALYILPPRSPKYNGVVERTNGTFRYEFYHAWDTGYNLATLRTQLESFTEHFNTYRPHQSLHNLTPACYLQKISQQTRESNML
jgi:putative transposase